MHVLHMIVQVYIIPHFLTLLLCEADTLSDAKISFENDASCVVADGWVFLVQACLYLHIFKRATQLDFAVRVV